MLKTIAAWVFGYGLVLALLATMAYYVLATARVLIAYGPPLGKRRLLVWSIVGCACTMVAWLSCEIVVFDWMLGGDPFRGKIDGDRYFLGRGSGEYTEVSQPFYWTSYWLLIVIRATLAAFVAGTSIQVLLRRRSAKAKKLS